MRDCSSCEIKLPDNAHFCSHCGHGLNGTTTIDGATNMGPSLEDMESLDITSPSHHASTPSQMESLDITSPSHRASTLSQKALGKLPVSVQKGIGAILIRARDPQAEVSYIEPQKAKEIQAQTWGWLPILALTDALGVLCMAHAFTSARLGLPGADFFFWFSLLLIFVPSTVRLLSPTASRFERISLLCMVAICFYLVKLTNSPLYFSGYDEFLHIRTAEDIASSGHLFTGNSLLYVSPFYPGLEIVTNALSGLSGLSIFSAGITVVGVAHLLMILSLFMLYELLTKSARVAGLATILYMASPSFLFFDALFAYESLALPLAALVLFVLARHETSKSGRLGSMLVAWIILGATVVTHHLTGFILDALLLLWAGIYVLQRGIHLRQSNVVPTALFGLFISLVWASLWGNPVSEYLSSYVFSAVTEIRQILAGASSARHFFVYTSGQAVPLWQRFTAISAVGMISLVLPFGLLCLWLRYRSNALAWMFGIVSLFYPISHLFRLTYYAEDIPGRSAAYIFIPLAFVLALFITQFWPTRRLSWKQISLITCAISVVFLGNVTLGSGTASDLMPGPYIVIADGRSVEPEGIQAATWTFSHLGPNNRVATDRVNQILMSDYGDQRLVVADVDKVDIASIFFSPSFGYDAVATIRQGQIRYLVVDLRLSRALPLVGFYYEVEEPGRFQRTTPIDRQALMKFSTVSQINRLFDSGDIVIYDVGAFTNK